MALPTASSDIAKVSDLHLMRALKADDDAERAGMSPFERLTCPVHRRWIHECISSPVHVVRFTGHRWCGDCGVPATVAVDQLAGVVHVRCPRCTRSPATAATDQIVRVCEASMAAERGLTFATKHQGAHIA